MFGATNLVILLVVMEFKRYALTSQWCAYAAVASVIILAYFWRSSEDRPFLYAQQGQFELHRFKATSVDSRQLRCNGCLVPARYRWQPEFKTKSKAAEGVSVPHNCQLLETFLDLSSLSLLNPEMRNSFWTISEHDSMGQGEKYGASEIDFTESVHDSRASRGEGCGAEAS
jgi:hypothetical protein